MNKVEFIKGLLEVMNDQRIALNKLLLILEKQHEYIIKDDVFGMEAVVEDIQKSNQEVADLELKRRQFTNGLLEDKTLGKLIYELDNPKLIEVFRKVRNKLEEIRLQKDTNDLLIKQGISLNNRILAFLNPDRQAKTYNGYGKMRR
ncbi:MULTISPECIES: flagellar protein FlgN [Clostridium]|nr:MULTISPECIES: flagellar protein FlgN [Clostridium]KEH88356.1 flagellar biosynthesis protein FlgN [Clostridium novyi A str. NCTC 538]KEH94323.1 flagellar biosynthesis protein FlgN [Clostridium botulinum C/D str. It1]KEH95020.1 flagellar biosynthesis protein FlgN [Clostridium novyi A str. GD211209]